MILKDRTKKPVVVNGKLYASISDAALAIGTSHNVLSRHYSAASKSRLSVYETEITVKKKIEIKIPKQEVV